MPEITISDPHLIGLIRWTVRGTLTRAKRQINEAVEMRAHPTKYKSPPWQSRITNSARDAVVQRDRALHWLEILNA